MSDKAMSLADVRKEAIKTTPARKRLEALFDPDTFVEIGAFVKNGCDGAGVITGYGLVEGGPVYAFSQDNTERGGAVGAAHGSKIKKIYEMALKTGAPMVGIYDSNGAAIDEGLDALDAYGEMLCWSNNLSGVVPQISLVLGVCAGSAAMIAASADFVVMSKKGEFFLNVGDEESSNAEAAAQNGVAHLVEADDEAAIASARRLLALIPSNNLSIAPMTSFATPEGGEAALEQMANNMNEADLFEGAKHVVDTDSMLELQKGYSGCGARVGLATLAGMTVGVVAASASGTLCPGGCSKIARFVAICDSFHLPVLTFINCEGFASRSPRGFRGGVREVAKLAHVYAEATTPKISVVVGKAFGSAYVALAGRGSNIDYTIAWPNAVISALAPRTAIAFMGSDRITAGKTREQAETEYAAVDANPLAAAVKGHIDDVIAPGETRAALLAALDMLAEKRVSRLPKKHANIPM